MNNLVSIILVLSLFCIFHCDSYYLVRDIKVKDYSREINATDKKIALIGFCRWMNGRHLLPKERQKKIDFYNLFKEEQGEWKVYNDSYKSFMNFGVSARTFPNDENNSTEISEDKIKYFVKKYLQEVKHDGQYELSDLIEVKNNKPVIMKKVDYYVMGVLNPPFRISTTVGKIVRIITLPFSIISLGTIPYFDQEKADIKFIVYDGKLNYSKTIQFDQEYWDINAWWLMLVVPDPDNLNFKLMSSQLGYRPFPEFIYQNDVNKFSYELYEIIKNDINLSCEKNGC